LQTAPLGHSKENNALKETVSKLYFATLGDGGILPNLKTSPGATIPFQNYTLALNTKEFQRR